MTWKYLLIHSDDFITYEEAKNFLNALVEIDDWLHVFQNTFILTASKSASDIGDALLRYVQKNSGMKSPDGYYFITEIHEDRQGWIPRAAWELMDGKPAKKVLPAQSVALEEGEAPI